jgi:hypothetical protein
MPCSYGARLQRPLTKRGFGGLINRIGCGSADAASLNLTLSLATCSSVSDTFQRDRAEARNVAVGEPVKAVDVVRRFECDYHPGLGQSGIEVVSNGCFIGTFYRMALMAAPVRQSPGTVLHRRGFPLPSSPKC